MKGGQIPSQQILVYMHVRPSINLSLRLTTLAILGVAGLILMGLAVLGLWRSSYEFLAEIDSLAWKEIGTHSVPLLALLVLNAVGAWFISGFCKSRSFRLAGILLAALLVSDLLAIDCLPFVLDAISSLATLRGAPLVYGAGLGLVALPWLALAALNALLPSWRLILAAYGIVAGLFLYLAWDEAPLGAPRTFAQLSPEFPGAKESYEVWMRFGSKHSAGRDFRSADRIYRTKGFAQISQPAAWTKWIRRARPAFEADWAELLPVRQWILDLDRFERIADLTPVAPDTEMIGFAPLRAYIGHCCAISGLLAMDNKGDEAIALILPSLRVSRKLETYSRSLIRTSVAGFTQRNALSTIEYILNTTTVSVAMQRQLATALAERESVEEQVEHLLDVEIAAIAESQGRINWASNLPPGPTKQLIDLLGPVALNPRRTDNLYLGYVLEEKRVVTSGRTPDEEGRAMVAYFAQTAEPRVRNYFGYLLYHRRQPSDLYFVQAFRNMAIRRAALRDRLAR